MRIMYGRGGVAAAAALAGLMHAGPAVAQQPDLATVPNLKGMSVKAAYGALERAGLQPAGDRLALESSDGRQAEFVLAKDGRVTSQSDAPGNKRRRGSTVAVSTDTRAKLHPAQWFTATHGKHRVLLRDIVGP